MDDRLRGAEDSEASSCSRTMARSAGHTLAGRPGASALPCHGSRRRRVPTQHPAQRLCPVTGARRQAPGAPAEPSLRRSALGPEELYREARGEAVHADLAVRGWPGRVNPAEPFDARVLRKRQASGRRPPPTADGDHPTIPGRQASGPARPTPPP